jgi:ABC-2 type transport system permease protein
MHTLATLARRELWEHRALWIVPIAMVAGLYLMPALFGQFQLQRLDPVTTEQAHAMVGFSSAILQMLVFLVVGIVLFFYLLDSLYAERKDRSILFWKSLPVSDALTVTSKLAVALLVIPLYTYALCIAGDLLARGVLIARQSAGAVGAGFPLWHGPTWIKSQGLMLTMLLASVLWYAPIAAYLTFVSAWARRSVVLWAVVPPLALVIIESVALGTGHVSAFIRNRLEGAIPHLFDGATTRADLSVVIERERLPSPAKLFDALDPSWILGQSGLWLGLAIAAGLFFAAVRVRRYRDDT